ncbi:MAG: antibiotic biosynthesis monooxygenase [Anaerolineales bacterium]|nr:MAG: antibiotic biosynthesis monooxygenase [Anaerolineales bacterium]
MYGTVARFQVKPGMAEALEQLGRDMAADPSPGFVARYVYRMDNNPDEFYVAVMYESREAYFANANSPEQHEQFLEMMELLAAEPEWHDGEVVFPAE